MPLTALECLTHTTTKNPDPIMPLAAGVPGDLPALFRRAALQAALGSARSFHSNRARWRQQKERAEAQARAKGKRSLFHVRPPVLPRQWSKGIVVYDGMWKEFDGHTVLLKVWTGSSWARVKFHVSGGLSRKVGRWVVRKSLIGVDVGICTFPPLVRRSNSPPQWNSNWPIPRCASARWT